MEDNWHEYRNKIIGLGDSSSKKSYYPDLQDKIEALEASRKNFETLYNSVSDGIIIHTTKGEILSANHFGKLLLKIDEIDEDTPNFFELLDDKDIVRNFRQISCKNQKEFPIIVETFICPKRSKQKVPVQISINRVVWDDQNALVSVIRDFSERKRIEEKLIVEKENAQTSQEKFRLLFQNMNSAFAYHRIITNSKGKPINYEYLEVNSQFEALTGLKAEDVVGKKVLDLIPDLEKVWIEKFGEVALTGKSIEYTDYVKGIDKYFKAKAYSPQKGFFAITFSDVTQTKQALDKLKESEERFDLAMTAVNEGVWDWNIPTNTVYYDSRYYRMAGYEPNEFPHSLKEWEKRVHPYDIDECRKRMKAHFADQSEGFDIEFRFLKKDGSWMWINGKGKTVERAKDGSVIRMVGTHTDITHRKLAEEALSAKSVEFENYFTNALDLFCIANIEGDFLRVNKAWEEALGYSVSELENKNLLEFVHPDDKASTLRVLSKLKSQEQVLNFTNRYRTKDGHYRYIEWRLYPHGETIFAAARDITERKTLEDELVKHKDNLELLVKERTEELEATNEELKSINEELYYQRAELEDTLNKLQDAQKQLVLSEKMASIGILTAGIAHEINNPINFISSGIVGLEMEVNDIISSLKECHGSIEELGQEDSIKSMKQINEAHNVPKSLENIPRLFKTIRTGVERTTAIIKGLRTFSRMDDESKTEASLNEIVNSTLTILYNKYKGRINVETDLCSPDEILCYPGKLGQLLLNILTNAIQAIEGSGTITIASSYIKKKNTYNIVISDTGKGIPKKVLPKIFDPFFTTKNVGEGTGLGLSIVHGIVSDHEGEISVNSGVGKGTEFIISLPKS